MRNKHWKLKMKSEQWKSKMTQRDTGNEDDIETLGTKMAKGSGEWKLTNKCGNGKLILDVFNNKIISYI